MKRTKKLIVGNWKMYPQSLEEAKKIVKDVKKSTTRVSNTKVVICPPFVFIAPLQSLIGKNISLGAQDAYDELSGAFTGEVSFSQLPQFGVDFVILGHSERRKMGETDAVINKKIKKVLSGGMTAIVCVGESQRDKSGDYFNFIKHQIIATLKDVSKKSLSKIVVAYEPIWAIGADEAMSASDLLETSIFIRKVLKDLYGVFADDVRILYGGSVDRVNADRLVKEGGVSGLLIGRQSLKAKDFVEIIKLVDSI